MALSEPRDVPDRYEFDAPTHILNFQELDDEDNADLWFDEQVNAGYLVHFTTPLESITKVNLPQAFASPQFEDCLNKGPAKSSSLPSNIVTSWDNEAKTAAQPQQKCSAQTSVQPHKVCKHGERLSCRGDRCSCCFTCREKKVKPPPGLLPHKSHFKVCPFSFEEREQKRRALREKLLQAMRKYKVPMFKAQPLPDFHEVVLPEKKVVEPTKPEPFKLLTDKRGAVKNDSWEQMMKDEQKRQAEASLFKARPNTVTHKKPFQPKKEDHTVLGDSRGVAPAEAKKVPEAFELCTERRALVRLESAKAFLQKEALKAQMEEQKRQEREKQDKEEIVKLRQEQVHKAQPIRHYKPLKQKSVIALTVPHSPNFSSASI